LFLSAASASLEGEEDLSHLCWVSTLKGGPALGVLSVSKYFGTKVVLWCPRLRRGLLSQHRIVLRVSENTNV